MDHNIDENTVDQYIYGCAAFFFALVMFSLFVKSNAEKLWSELPASTADLTEISQSTSRVNWASCAMRNPISILIGDLRAGRKATKADIHNLEREIEQCEQTIELNKRNDLIALEQRKTANEQLTVLHSQVGPKR